MHDQTRILRVIIASPGDVSAEREIVPEVLEQLNQSVCRDRGILLQPVRWETDAYPGFDELGAQGLIDPILRIEDCEVLIGIFWTRFGSPVFDGKSGTEHEILRAWQSWKRQGRPQIMVYFNQRKHTPQNSRETEQWGRVLDFGERFPDKGLFWKYNGKNQFKDLLRTHLSNYIQNTYPLGDGSLAGRKPPATPPRQSADYFAVQTRIIGENDRSFVGRAEVYDAFDLFLAHQPRGYFIVRGGPGQGKTALSCHLICTRSYPHHLVSRTGGRCDARLILRSLLSQIGASETAGDPPESLSELTKAFEEALLSAASTRSPLVIVADAIDELPGPLEEAPWLVTDAVPDGVFFFVTCRPGTRLDRLDESLFSVPRRLYDLGPLGIAEMRALIQSGKPNISDPEVERIAEVSQGNPLYLRAVAYHLGRDPNFSLRDLPVDIEGFFRSAISQVRDTTPLLREVLGLLSVARTPFTIAELAAITGQPQRVIDEQTIQPIRQFLLSTGGAFTFYHMKFHEFITTNVLYEDEMRKSHLAIAAWLASPANASNPYRWSSLAHHLFEGGDRAALLAAIDAKFLAGKLRRFGYGVLEDIELLARTLLDLDDPSVVERCVILVEALREIAGGDIVADTARRLQPWRSGPISFRTRLLTPEVASIPGLDIYVGVLPKAEVPADFFEIVPLGDHLAVAIGDAPAVGLKSSFAARFLGNLFHRTVQNANALDLAALIAHMDSMIAGYDYFRRISMQCLDFSPDRGIFRIANAGHPNPVHYCARRGKCDILPVAGELLHDYRAQNAPAPAWEEYQVEIEPGDIVVLISDGLTEGHYIGGDPFGYRFTEMVERLARERPSAIGEAILDSWKAHPREEDSADDVSVIVIGINGPKHIS